MDGAYRLTAEELEAGLEDIRRSPPDGGLLELIVRRPASERRDVRESGDLDPAVGLVGDAWGMGRRGDPDTQLTIMNARAAGLIAGEKDRWALAGDQLYADLDLSVENLPPGTRLAVGSAVVEIAAVPHLGCRKFSARFGPEALRFVNSEEGRRLRLRGVYARVVEPGVVWVRDALKKI